jgi:trk system potassium uptake protein TrkH
VTTVETILLMAGGMSFFDAICHSFATIASGGFSTKNASIAHFDSVYIDWVITAFMFVAGTNFTLDYMALRGRFKSYFRDNEFVFFLISFLVATLIVTIVIREPFYSGDVESALRHAAFNVMSVMSCTGFATADWAIWAPLAQVILLFLLFPGACAGSTGGAMKNIRVLLLLKAAVNELKRLLHPSAVVPIKYNGKMVDQDSLFTIAGFIILYLVTFASATILMTAMGYDIVTSMSAVASCMANCGPGLSAVGPMANYAHLSDAAKWLLDACMILGRLELFTVFVLFSRAFWRT